MRFRIAARTLARPFACMLSCEGFLRQINRLLSRGLAASPEFFDKDFRRFLIKPGDPATPDLTEPRLPSVKERRPGMIRILALAAVAALLVVPSSYAFAARGGASGLAPGQEMRGLHGHSFNAPGQEFRRAGKVGTPGHPGASRFAPGHGG
jgi:hypothetical protein